MRQREQVTTPENINLDLTYSVSIDVPGEYHMFTRISPSQVVSFSSDKDQTQGIVYASPVFCHYILALLLHLEKDFSPNHKICSDLQGAVLVLSIAVTIDYDQGTL